MGLYRKTINSWRGRGVEREGEGGNKEERKNNLKEIFCFFICEVRNERVFFFSFAVC